MSIVVHPAQTSTAHSHCDLIKYTKMCDRITIETENLPNQVTIVF